MARRSAAAAVLFAAVLSTALTGACTDAEVTTSPTAHESPPPPPAPFESIYRSGFLGGSGLDEIDDVLLAPDGSVYVVGGTASPNFPTTDGSTLDATTPAGCSACPFDGFVARLGPDGVPDWVRLIGGPGYERLTAVALVGDTVYVGGSTGARAGLDGWHGGADPAGERGEQDGLVCALAAGSGDVQTCRYLGGTGAGGVTDLALTSAGFELIAVMIAPAGEDLHLDAGYEAAFDATGSTPRGGADVAMFALRAGLPVPLALSWATYLGGSGDERGTPAVLTDASAPGAERIVLLTETTSRDLPTPMSFAPTPPAGDDNAYIATYLTDGRTQLHGAYLGGSGVERVTPSSLVAIGSGLVVAGLSTTSTDAPSIGGGSQPQHGGNGGAGCGDGDLWLGAFVFGSSQSSILASTFYGGTNGERLGGLSKVALEFGLVGVVASGTTHSTNLPVQRAAQYQFAGPACTAVPGSAEAFAVVFEPQFWLRGATYLGGIGVDRSTALAGNPSGRVVVVGTTASSNFPAFGPGDLLANGGVDGFITEYGPAPWIPPGDGGVGSDGGCFECEGDGGVGGDGGNGVGTDAGEPYTESGAFCVCGAGGSPAGAAGPTLLVVAMVLFRRRRRR